MNLRKWNREKRTRAGKVPQFVESKIEKTMACISNPILKSHIPETRIFSPEVLEEMLKRFSFVILKPDVGRKGYGVISVRKNPRGVLIHYETQEIEYADIWEGMRLIKDMSDEKTYLVQQGIELLKIAKRPLDVRVSMQKPYSEWRFTGIAARLAGPGKVVTNRSSGGEIIPFACALAQCGVCPDNILKVRESIKQISLNAAKVLNGKYRGLRELGIDIGLDQSLFPWIFEINTRPVYKLFGMLPDKSMYNMIRKYHRMIWRGVTG